MAAYIFVNNLYIEIIGVLLATIWASKGRLENTDGSLNSGTPLSSIAYRIGGNGSHRTQVKTETSTARSGGDLELGEFSATPPQDEHFTEVPKSRGLVHNDV
jgi:hypothetical protein